MRARLAEIFYITPYERDDYTVITGHNNNQPTPLVLSKRAQLNGLTYYLYEAVTTVIHTQITVMEAVDVIIDNTGIQMSNMMTSNLMLKLFEISPHLTWDIGIKNACVRFIEDDV